MSVARDFPREILMENFAYNMKLGCAIHYTDSQMNMGHTLMIFESTFKRTNSENTKVEPTQPHRQLADV